MAAIVIAVGAFQIVFGERIGINAGQGWDGQAYMRWSGDWWHRLVDLGTDKYQAGRVFPSLIVYEISHTFRIDPTVPNHCTIFAGVDVAMLAFAAALWAHLATSVMRWRAGAAWVGFAALFGCFANARHAVYDPVLTDPTAFALGMLAVWGYLARKTWAVWLAGALGAFTWPAMTMFALPLVVLPRPAEPVAPVAGRTWVRIAAAVIAVSATAAFLIAARHFYLHPEHELGMEKFVEWVRSDLLIVTVPLLAATVAAAYYLLLAQPRAWNVVGYARTLRWWRVAIAIAACAAVLVLRAWWIDAVGFLGPGASKYRFMSEHTLQALRGPAWGLVYHVVYFGPIVIVAVLAWRRIAQIAAEWGPGIVVAVAVMIAFAASSQSRQWIQLFPLLATLAVAATHERWTPRAAAIFGVLALAWSKLWLHIGFDQVVNGWHEFPDQRYYMQLGPWASDETYVVHLAAALITVAVLAWVLRRKLAVATTAAA
jgi:hypothetical protein